MKTSIQSIESSEGKAALELLAYQVKNLNELVQNGNSLFYSDQIQDIKNQLKKVEKSIIDHEEI